MSNVFVNVNKTAIINITLPIDTPGARLLDFDALEPASSGLSETENKIN